MFSSKFDCTHALRPGGIVVGLAPDRFQARRPKTTTSPVGGGGASRNCTATRRIMDAEDESRAAPVSVTGAFALFRTVTFCAKRRLFQQRRCSPVGVEGPSPTPDLPDSSAPVATKGRSTGAGVLLAPQPTLPRTSTTASTSPAQALVMDE